jgi:hypothetical protein
VEKLGKHLIGRLRRRWEDDRILGGETCWKIFGWKTKKMGGCH